MEDNFNSSFDGNFNVQSTTSEVENINNFNAFHENASNISMNINHHDEEGEQLNINLDECDDGFVSSYARPAYLNISKSNHFVEGDFFNNNNFSDNEVLNKGMEKLSVCSNERNSFLTNGCEKGVEMQNEKEVNYIVLKMWQENHTNKLRNIEENERKEIDKLREEAREQIANFYERRKTKIVQKMEMNRSEEKKKINQKDSLYSNNLVNGIPNGVKELKEEESWQKVLNLIDLSKNTHQRDTSRFKDILLTLTAKN